MDYANLNVDENFSSNIDELNFNEASSYADNETGFPFDIVPNIVHYVRFENPYLDFITFISIKSVLINHKPEAIWIHCDFDELKGKYWDLIRNQTGNSNKNLNTVTQGKQTQTQTLTQTQTQVIVKRIKRPFFVFGKKLSSVYHSSDIARIEILMKYGGIFLDNDVFVVKSLNHFRKFEFTIGWPHGEFLGTQVLIGHNNARFLKLWHDSYENYRPTSWYYNAGQLPTEKFLIRNPGLVHRVKTEFGVHNLVQMLYNENYPFWETEFYAVHLLARHRSYLMPRDRIKNFNEINIKTYNRTFGQMARFVIYGTKNLID